MPNRTQQLVDDLVNATNSYRSLKIRVTKQGQEIEAGQTKVRPPVLGAAASYPSAQTDVPLSCIPPPPSPPSISHLA